MKNSEDLKKTISDLIANNKTEKAFEVLAKKQLSQLDKQLIILSNRFNKVKDEQRMGILSNEEANRELTKINLALIDLSGKIGKKEPMFSDNQNIASSNMKFFIPIIVGLLMGGFFLFNSDETSTSNSGEGTETPIESTEDIDWRAAIENPTIASLNGYLNKYPSGKHEEDAKEMISDIEKEKALEEEKIAWSNVLEANVIADYEAYMNEYPEGQFISDANIRIDNLKLEDKIWATTLKKSTLEDYKSYLSLFESGRYSELAHKKIKEIGEESMWERAKEKDKLEFYKEYLTAFPEGKYAQIAQKKVDEIEATKKKLKKDADDFKQATLINTIKAYKEYIQKHPKGLFVAIARINMKAIEASKECECPPKTFRTVSDHTWAEFRMPKAKGGTTVNIPEGVHNKYVFPKCNRVWWTNLTFTCNPNTCNWEKISGTWDADALCHGGRTPHKYLFVGER